MLSVKNFKNIFQRALVKGFILAMLTTIPYAPNAVAAAACSDDEDEDRLQKIEKPAAGLYVASICTNSSAFEAYKVDRKSLSQTIVKLENISYCVGRNKGAPSIKIAQFSSNCLKVSPEEMKDSGFITFANLRRALGKDSLYTDMVPKEIYVDFLKKAHLDRHLDEPTIPSILMDSYIGVEKDYLKMLIDNYAHDPRSKFTIIGGPTTCLIAATLRILEPKLSFRLILFGYVPRYTEKFLSAMSIDYIRHRDIRSGYPDAFVWFEKKFLGTFSKVK